MQAFMDCFGIFSLFMFCMLNLFLCLQVETSSDLLLSKNCFSAFMMHSFSSKHKLHLFDPPEYELACFKIDHVMVKCSFFSLSFQICFESSVSFAYFLFRKDLV